MNTEGVVYMSSVGRGLLVGAPSTVRLQVRSSSRCARVPNGSLTAGTQLVQYDCNDGLDEKWTFEDMGSGYWRLKVSHSSMCMDLATQSASNNVAVVQAACGSGQSQQWLKEDMGSGYYRLRNRLSSRCLDVTGNKAANNIGLIQYNCSNNGLNQQWTNY
jgi:hypothetical protein